MIQLFTGIDDEGIKRLAQCMRLRIHRFQAGETISSLGMTIEKLGILMRGSAHMEMTDAEGTCTRMEALEEGDVFGELFFLPREDQYCEIKADSWCQVMFLDWQHVIRPCPQSCDPHARLIANLFQLTAEKSRQLSAYTTILTQRSVRSRLLTYLSALSKETGSDTVTIPMSLAALSEYLCVDRSAMMREIKQLRKEGILTSDKRVFTLL